MTFLKTGQVFDYIRIIMIMKNKIKDQLCMKRRSKPVKYVFNTIYDTAIFFSVFPIGWSCRIYCPYTRLCLPYTHFPCGTSPNRLI